MHQGMAVEIETPLKVSAGSYMKRVFAMWFSYNAWWMLLLLVVCVSFTMLDAKWSVIAFILYLAGLMMGLSLVYFNYAFSPLARWSVMEKTALIDEAGIRFTFEHPKMNAHFISWNEVTRIDFRTSYTLLYLKGACIKFVMLPSLDANHVDALKQLYLNK